MPRLVASFYPGAPNLDYEPGVYSGIPLDGFYAVERGVAGLVQLPLSHERRQSFLIPRASIEALVRFADPDSDLADRIDVVFTRTQVVVIERYQANAGIFVGADVYPLARNKSGFSTLGTAAAKLVPFLAAATALYDAAGAEYGPQILSDKAGPPLRLATAVAGNIPSSPTCRLVLTERWEEGEARPHRYVETAPAGPGPNPQTHPCPPAFLGQLTKSAAQLAANPIEEEAANTPLCTGAQTPAAGFRGCDHPEFVRVAECAVVQAGAASFGVATIEGTGKVQPRTFALLVVVPLPADSISAAGPAIFRAFGWKLPDHRHDERQRSLTVERICELVGQGAPEMVILDERAAGSSRKVLGLSNGKATWSEIENLPGAAEVLKPKAVESQP